MGEGGVLSLPLQDAADKGGALRYPAMDAFEAMESRSSVRAFLKEEPPREVVERLLAAAVRAPNHKLTEPWRFVIVRGDAKRRYADIRRAHRAQKFADPGEPDAAAKIATTF